jgi:hypothetical protein
MAGKQFSGRGATKGAAAKKKLGTKGTAVAHAPATEPPITAAAPETTKVKPPVAMPPLAPSQATTPTRIDELSQGAQVVQEQPIAEAPAAAAPAPIHAHVEISMGAPGNGAAPASGETAGSSAAFTRS